MPKVPREVLKQYFQTGDKPTQPQFSTMLDSMVNFSDDRDFIGLRDYNATQEYLPGDCAVFADQVVQCLIATTGTFNPADWKIISAFGSVTYVSSWDTQANVPPLQSSVGTKGFYYVVTNASPDPDLNTELNGINDWGIGDWAIFNGSVWQKVDNSQAPVEASNVTYIPSGSLQSNNVQDALDELNAEMQPKLELSPPAIPYAADVAKLKDSWLRNENDGIALNLLKVFRSQTSGEAQLDFGVLGDEVLLSTAGTEPKESRLFLTPKDARMYGEVILLQQNGKRSQLMLQNENRVQLSNDGGSGSGGSVNMKSGAVSMQQGKVSRLDLSVGGDGNGQANLTAADNYVDITTDTIDISINQGAGAGVVLKSSGDVIIGSDNLIIDTDKINVPSSIPDTVAYFDAGNNLKSSIVLVSELNALAGVTAPIQTQLNDKLNISGGTMTGELVLSADPVLPLEAGTKQYIDNADSALQIAVDSKVNKAGDAMSGPLFLSGNPTLPLQAAPKQYVDDADLLLQSEVNSKVSKTGDTMNGLLTLSGNPVAALDAVTKQYADAIQSSLAADKVSKAGDTMTGPLILDADPVSALGATTKQYVDAATRKILVPFTFNNDFGTNSAAFTSIPLQVVIPAPSTVFPGATTVTAKLTIDFMTENGATPAQGQAGLSEWTTGSTVSLIAGSLIPMPVTSGVWTKSTTVDSFSINGNRTYRVIFRKTAGSGNAQPRIESAMLTLFYS